MSWIKERSHRKQSSLGVAVSLRKIAAAPRLKFVITLGPDVLEKLGWKVGSEVSFFRGDGEHAGRARLCSDRAEGYRLRWFGQKGKNQDKLTVAVWAWDALPTEKQRVTQCAWRVTDHALEFDLPSWARPDKTAHHVEAVRAPIVDVLRWCNENGIPVAPRGKGYSIGGQQSVDAGAVVARANAKRTRLELPPFAVVHT